MFVLLDLVVLTTTVWLVADSPPSLKVEQFCRGFVERAAPFADFETCLSKEREMREQVVRTWAQFHSDDRAHCARLMTAGGAESTYTALLTCLEVQRDARNIRERNQRGTTGLGKR